MGRYFDTALAVATFATPATGPREANGLSQMSQESRRDSPETDALTDIIDLRDAFEERAAIMEFDGGFTRAEAERLAALDVGFQAPGTDQETKEIQSVDPSVDREKREEDNGSA